MATARAKAAEAEVDKLKAALTGAESKLSEYQQYAHDLAMIKCPDEPLMALWEVLNDERLEGPSAAMAIISNPKCGISRSITVDDNDPFWAEIILKNTSAVSTLLCVVIADRLDVMEAISECLNDPHKEMNYEKHQLLSTAAWLGRVDILEYLLKIGLDANIVLTASGMTALHAAAKKGFLESSKVLLTAGATTEARDIYGLQPLHFAAAGGHSELVKALVASGANVRRACKKGYGPLFYARGSGDDDTIRFLESRGASSKLKVVEVMLND